MSCVLFRSDQRHRLDQQKHIQMCPGLRVLQKIHTHTHTRAGGALTDGFLLLESNVTLWRIQASCMSSGWILHKAFGKLSSYEFEVVFLSVFVAMCLSIFVRVFFCILYVTLYLHVVCECVCVRPRPPKHSHILQITGLGTRRIISLWMWPLALL